MFELTIDEFTNLRSQIVTSNWGGARYVPMVFTEQGVAMLSSVLRSKQAIRVNIQIMRIFTKLRAMLTDNLSIKLEIEEIKKKLQNQDKNIELVFSYLDELIEKKEKTEPRRQIGYKKIMKNNLHIHGCRLQSVIDGGTNDDYFAVAGNYGYDANGNMNSDPSKGTGVEYNYLNLPGATGKYVTLTMLQATNSGRW